MKTQDSPLTYTVPLSFSAHELAQKLTANLRDKRDPYLNALALFAVQNLFLNLGIETRIEQPKFPFNHLLPVSQITLPDLGQFHCLVMLPHETEVAFPDPSDEALGYIVVRLAEDLREAVILGFSQAPAPSIVADHLEDIESLISYISDLEKQAEMKAAAIAPTADHPFINLRDWLSGSFPEGWVALSSMFSLQPAIAFRGNSHFITRAYPIQMRMPLSVETSLALIVSLHRNAEDVFDVIIGVSALDQTCLPEQLQLKILDLSKGLTIASNTTDSDSKLLKYSLSAQSGDRFQTQILFQGEEVCQDFRI